jgi:hypothetical protein
MLVGVLFLLGGALAVVLIPAMMFPILKKQNEGMALGYLVLRVVEGVTQVADALILLTLLSLSQEFVAAGLPVSSSFQTSGALISAANNWATLFDPIVFGLGALIFYYMLYASRLVPRWLSVWGLLGGALVFAFGLMWMFGNEQLYLALPIAVQEMVLAAWLIVKGFNRQATIYSGATK